ncbi:metal ABC transporter substrate-binding protein [soil metagenome]
MAIGRHGEAARFTLMLGLGLSAIVLSACGGNDGSGEAVGASQSEDDPRPVVATTVAPITSIVSNVVGDLAQVRGIVPEGTNSPTFEPRPSVAELLSTADVIFINGLQLEEPTKDLAQANMADDAELVELGTTVLPEADYLYDFSFPEEEGKPNPHLWTDPRYAVAYAEVIRDTMSDVDPDNADTYAANTQSFTDLVDDFDAAMRDAFDTIPDGNKKLLTYHDAYAYFAVDYDWEVIGAIQVSDFEEPTAREVADLIRQVEQEQVPAIFGSEVFPSPVLEQIGQEAGVEYVDVLRDDDLPGEPGDPEHSWLGLMRFDFVTMTDALGGDPAALESFEVRNVAPDEADYPQ